MQKNYAENIKKFVLYSILIAGGIVMLFPFLWLVSASIRPATEVFTYPPTLIPAALRLKNFSDAIEMLQIRTVLNSVIFTVVIVGGLTVFGSMTGFALSKIPLPGRDVIFIGIIAAMLLPPQIMMIPQFLTIKYLRWFDTYYGLIIPVLAHFSFGTLLFRQFFKQIPDELSEAAILDGCGYFGMYFKIFIPLSKGPVAAFGVVTFLNAWNLYLWPLISTNSMKMRVIPLAIAQMIGDYSAVPWNVILATVFLVTIPVIIAFILAQRYFVAGLAHTGIKV